MNKNEYNKIHYWVRKRAGMIAKIYASQFTPKWISVADFIPEKETAVIAGGGSMREPRMVILRHGDFEEIGYGFTVYPSHWMHLPEKPQT